MRLLAQSIGYGDAFLWSAVILGLCIGMFFLFSLIRKKVRNADEGPVTGFTLADLRELHRSGKMSSDEFERAKEILLHGMKTASQSKGSVDPNRLRR